MADEGVIFHAFVNTYRVQRVVKSRPHQASTTACTTESKLVFYSSHLIMFDEVGVVDTVMTASSLTAGNSKRSADMRY